MKFYSDISVYKIQINQEQYAPRNTQGEIKIRRLCTSCKVLKKHREENRYNLLWTKNLKACVLFTFM